jgi:hypothetical protein
MFKIFLRKLYCWGKKMILPPIKCAFCKKKILHPYKGQKTCGGKCSKGYTIKQKKEKYQTKEYKDYQKNYNKKRREERNGISK